MDVRPRGPCYSCPRPRTWRNGRRKGLKIPRELLPVPVQARQAAPVVVAADISAWIGRCVAPFDCQITDAVVIEGRAVGWRVLCGPREAQLEARGARAA